MMAIKLNKLSAVLLSLIFFVSFSLPPEAKADSNTDNTEIAEASRHIEYLAPIFAYKGSPLNNDTNKKVTLLINHGYMVGYSADRKQPLWATYRVSKARRFVDYERPPFFYADLRLPESARVGPETFTGYDRGHMVPNSAINTQYGKLAQMETFLMSNICPQHRDLNRRLWQTLERRVANNYALARDQIWVISGPIFEQNIGQINGVDIPTHFYMILVDVGQYPTYRPYILAFKFPQQPSDGSQLVDFLVSVNHIEEKINLNFFPDFNDAQESDYETEAADEVWPIN
jgi:endonuclease G